MPLRAVHAALLDLSASLCPSLPLPYVVSPMASCRAEQALSVCANAHQHEPAYGNCGLELINAITALSEYPLCIRPSFQSSMIETTVLDFKLSNSFEEYRAYMEAPAQQAMFSEMGVQIFYLGVSHENPNRATVMFQGQENVLYDIFANPQTKPIVEASGHVYEGTVITRWLAQ